MADSVDAIIVVGPVLWKCVNCDLLFSRQHSIDDHLRRNHPTAAGSGLNHKDSVYEKCSVPRCRCKSLSKEWTSGGIKKRRKKRHQRSNKTREDVTTVVDNGNDDSIEMKGSSDDSLEDEDQDMLQKLRDRVNEMVKEREGSENMETTVDSSMGKEAIKLDDNVMPTHILLPKVDTKSNCKEADFVEDSAQSDEDPRCLAPNSDSIHNLSAVPAKSRSSKTTSINNKVKHKAYAKDNADSFLISAKKRRKKDKKVKEDTDESCDEQKDVVSSSQMVPEKRTSGRSNKGKNSSFYSDYKVEIS